MSEWGCTGCTYRSWTSLKKSCARLSSFWAFGCDSDIVVNMNALCPSGKFITVIWVGGSYILIGDRKYTARLIVGIRYLAAIYNIPNMAIFPASLIDLYPRE